MRGRLTPAAKVVLIFVLAGAFLLVTELAHCQTPPVIRVIVLPGEFVSGGVTDDATIASAMRDVSALWTAASLNQTQVRVQIGPRTLIQRQPGTCNQAWAQGAAQTAQAAGFSWDKIVFIQQYDDQCKYGGEATLGGCCSFENSGVNIWIIAHEGGHSWFALPHSWGVFFVGVFGDFANAQLKEYGHRTDVMSGGDTVAAIWRYRLGWLTPVRIPRDGAWHRIHLEPITQRQDAFSIQREDGIEWWGERRVVGQVAETLDITSTYGGVPTWAAAPAVGEDMEDPVGGVTIRSLGAGDYSVRGYPPTWAPPIVVTPTPGPVQNTPTPPPAECWAQYPFIKCSPTPAAATSTPTPTPLPPSPTETPASVVPTPLPDTPTCVPATSTPTPVPATPSVTPTRGRPPTSVGSSGCSSRKAGMPGELLIVAVAFLLRRPASKA
jgi:hypothetical protein